MERTKYFLVCLFALFSAALIAQNNPAIYSSYAAGKMSEWKHTIDSIEALKLKGNKELLDLVNYQYGYVGWCIGKKKSEEAEQYMSSAHAILKLLEQRKYNLSILYAYKAAFVGFSIGLATYKAPIIGPKSIQYAKKSISLDSTNCWGHMQLGNIAFYTPKVFGGSKTEAVKHYLKALRLMEKDKAYRVQNWNYLNLLATIINAYMDLNQYETARKYCVKALAVEPKFSWVKNNLYPKISEKLNNE